MIESITRSVKQDLQKYESVPERIESLKDRYHGETCYIVSAGPSLKNYEPEYLRSKLENKLVFTIKQSYLLFIRRHPKYERVQFFFWMFGGY